MNSTIDMSTPVTRGELREELNQFEERIERKFDTKLDQLEERIERKFDTKLDQLEERIERKFDTKLDQLDRKFNTALDVWGGALLAQINESEKRLLIELARHAQAAYEAIPKQIAAVDERYQDLPGRTTRLEVEVEGLTAEVNALK